MKNFVFLISTLLVISIVNNTYCQNKKNSTEKKSVIGVKAGHQEQTPEQIQKEMKKEMKELQYTFFKTIGIPEHEFKDFSGELNDNLNLKLTLYFTAFKNRRGAAAELFITKYFAAYDAIKGKYMPKIILATLNKGGYLSKMWKEKVKNNFFSWAKRDTYEKSEEYKSRMYSKNEKIEEFTRDVILKELKATKYTYKVVDYNVDTEECHIVMENNVVEKYSYKIPFSIKLDREIVKALRAGSVVIKENNDNPENWFFLENFIFVPSEIIIKDQKYNTGLSKIQIKKWFYDENQKSFIPITEQKKEDNLLLKDIIFNTKELELSEYFITDYTFKPFDNFMGKKIASYFEVSENGKTLIRCNNTNIKEVNMHAIDKLKNIEFIGDRAFEKCEELRTINITDNVKSIGKLAFSFCSSLESIIIPDSIIDIEENAFEGCYALKSIKFSDNIKNIKANAFKSCTSLVSVHIGKELRVIDDNAFSFCSSLKSITISSSEVSLGKSAFQGCSSLSEIKTPNSFINIGNFAFKDCTSLTSINIFDKNSTIGYNVFEGCSSLKNITIPSGITNIENGFFEGCSGLKFINIPNSIESIGYHAFASCISLENITIPDSVKSIGFGTFKDCTSLKSVNISDAVTSIEKSTFENCTALNYVHIGNNVTDIKERAFFNCLSLTSITLPSTLKNLGAKSFGECRNLDSISFKSITPPNLAERYMFFWPNYIYVPEESIEIYKKYDDFWREYMSKIYPDNYVKDILYIL